MRAAGAWCLFELTTSLGAGHKLHVALSPSDRANLRPLLEGSFDSIAHIFARLDARDAQITKVEGARLPLPRRGRLRAPPRGGDEKPERP